MLDIVYVGRLSVAVSADTVGLDHVYDSDIELVDLYVQSDIKIDDVCAHAASGARLAVNYLDADPFGFAAELAIFRDKRRGDVPMLMLEGGRLFQWRPYKQGFCIDPNPRRAEEMRAMAAAALKRQ
jgi:hypothetical protein